MRVCKDKCRTPDEELEHIDYQISQTGNFFAVDVHPNVVRADKILFERLRKKRQALMQSPEYLARYD